ncbi:MAG: putative metal-binding motif-containing protein, partial [Myxococcota bacterium]
GNTEVCDGVDNDCNGAVDEGSESADPYYADSDNDGYGDPEGLVYACEQPDGFVEAEGDCNDRNAKQFPGADELCNGEDDDCDNLVDEEGVIDGELIYDDADKDGYGDPASGRGVCEVPSGALTTGGDCDDSDPAIRAGCTCTDSSNGDLLVETDGARQLDSGVYHYDNVTVEVGGVLSFRGEEPVTIYAKTVTIDGLIDVSGKDGGTSALRVAPDGGSAGPGGGGGGGGGTCGNGNGSGGYPNGGDPTGGSSRSSGGDGGPAWNVDAAVAKGGSAAAFGGGGGGGHRADGRNGGESSPDGGAGGVVVGNDEMSVEFGGGGGGAGGATNGGGGGGGGGALQSFAAVIEVSGETKANGGYGGGGTTNACQSGGGGGGAGGAIWLHADKLVVDDGQLTATGGRAGISGATYGGGAGSDGRIQLSAFDANIRARRIQPSYWAAEVGPPCPLPDESDK